MYKKEVYGLFGQIELCGVRHLIVIEESVFEGQILKANVYRVQKVKFIPIVVGIDMSM